MRSNTGNYESQSKIDNTQIETESRHPRSSIFLRPKMKVTMLLLLMVANTNLACKQQDVTHSNCQSTPSLPQICPMYMKPSLRTECSLDYLQDQVNVTRVQHELDNKTLHSKIDGIFVQVDTIRQNMLWERTEIEEMKDFQTENKNYIKSLESKIGDVSRSNEKELHELTSKLNVEVYRVKDNIIEVKRELISSVKEIESSTDKKVDKMQEEIQKVNSTLDVVMINMTRKVEDDINELHADINELHADINELHAQSEQIKHHSEDKLKAHDTKITDISVKMDSEFSKTRSSIDSVVTELKGEINEKSEELKSYVDDVKADVDSDIKSVTKNLEDLTSEFEDHTEKVQNEFVNVNKKLDTDVDEMNKKLEQYKKSQEDDLQSKNEKLEDKLSDLSSVVAKHKQSVEDRFNNVDHKLETNIGKLNEKLTNLENKLITINKELETVKDNVKTKFENSDKKLDSVNENLKKDMGDMRDDLDNKINDNTQDLTKQTHEVNQTVILQKGLLETLYSHALNKGVLIMVILLLFIFTGINYLMIYWFVLRKNLSNTTNNLSVTLNKSSSSTWAQSRYGTYKPPTNSICIVGFNENSQQMNTELMTIIVPDMSDKIFPHLIRRHEDISDTPGTKICFMFVEFSERHVIIEEPGLGLGDLKRKTLHHIRESGACVVIVYVRDPGSRNIEGNKLYNEDIRCVTLQRELKELNKENRFISIYDTFTLYQLENLRKLIAENIK
ncbi:hypothetical protein ACF0H5_012643 [Mactra antiquata]